MSAAAHLFRAWPHQKGSSVQISSARHYQEAPMRITKKLMLATTLLSMVGLVLADDNAEKAVQEISPYRSWTRVTPAPVKIDVGTDTG